MKLRGTVGVDGWILWPPKRLGTSATGVAGGTFLLRDAFKFIRPLLERGVVTDDYDYLSLFDALEFAR